MSNDSFDRKAGSPSPLEESVERIVRELARVSRPHALIASNSEFSSGLDVSESVVRWALDASRGRGRYLPSELVSDPVWCMLLELLLGEIRGESVTLTSLSRTNFTSESCGARWARALEDKGLINQRQNPDEASNPLVELAPTASISLRCYFRDVVLDV